MKSFMIAAAAAAVALAGAPAWSGELGSKTGRCAPAGGGCAWTSTKCTRPTPPMLYVGSTAEINRAVEALNTYAGQLNTYMKCLSEEAQADAKGAVDAVQAGTNKLQSEASAEFNRLKSQFEADRLRVQTQPR